MTGFALMTATLYVQHTCKKMEQVDMTELTEDCIHNQPIVISDESDNDDKSDSHDTNSLFDDSFEQPESKPILKFHNSKCCWPYLPEYCDVESSSSTVALILGLGIGPEHICTSVPSNVQRNSSFLVNTENLKFMEDIRCDDSGSWVNNGVRKLYLEICNETDPKKIKINVLKRGGKPPEGRCWCLTRIYFFLKQAKDYKKIITSLQDHSGRYLNNQVIRYQFTSEEHSLPEALPHGNSDGSTPYKRQLQSTRNLLKGAAVTDKPQKACIRVEEQLGGIDQVPSISALPRNKQQVASIRRNLFKSSSISDPIMALIDLHKTEFPEFIRALRILPSPACILATDEQLQELLVNCMEENRFGIMHLDPTFNLGNFYVTPIVFPLIKYAHRKSGGGSPTLIGPVLLHHQMNYGTYSYFLNHLISMKPKIKQVKAFGTDGELALCNALRDSIPNAINLRCLKHVKDAIERKLQDLKFDKGSIQTIVADIFGVVSDGVHELGLSDASDTDDFFCKLMSIEEKWNRIEMDHRHFLATQKREPIFYDWFCQNYSTIFSESVVQSVRQSAGLGSPPVPFYNNRSESINRLLKKHVDHQKSSLPQFVRHLHKFIEEQSNNKKKADVQTGDWRIQSTSTTLTDKPHLSCPNDSILELSTIDKVIVDAIWDKAAQLVHSDGFIFPIPGNSSAKGRMVASSSSSSCPHIVTPGLKNDSLFLCDKNCPRFAAYKFCSHTVAVAEINGCLKSFVNEIVKRKNVANFSKLAYHGLQSAGEKGGKPKPKRRRVSTPMADLPVRDRFSSSSSSTTTSLPTYTGTIMQIQIASPAAQPYVFKMLTASIKVCAGCRLGYMNRSPPYNICIVHKETRPIQNPVMNKEMIIPVNAHYHATKSCILLKDPKFTPNQLVIPENMRQMLRNAVYNVLLQQEFGAII